MRFAGNTQDPVAAEKAVPFNALDDPAADQQLGLKEHGDDPAHTIDGGWRAWSCVLAGFLQLSICLGIGFAFGIYQAHYSFIVFPEASDLSISFIGSSNYATLVAACLFAGRPCEVFGMRPVAAFGSVLTVVGLLSASWCDSVPALIATQGVLAGLGGGFLFTPASALPVPWFKERRSLAMGIAASGAGAGGLAWSYIIQACIAAYGFRWALRITAFVTTAVLILSLFLMRTPPTSRKLAKAGSWKDSFLIFKTEKWLIPFYAAFIVFNFGYSTPAYYLPSYLRSQAQSSPSQGAAISAVLNAGNIVGRIGLGYFADRGLGVLNAFCLSMLLAGILQLCMWLPAQGNISVSFVFSFLYGLFGLAAIGISPAVLAKHLDPNKLPSIGGIFFTSEIPGFLAGAPISGAILARTNYHVTIGYSGSAMVLGGLLSVVARLMVSKEPLAKV